MAIASWPSPSGKPFAERIMLALPIAYGGSLPTASRPCDGLAEAAASSSMVSRASQTSPPCRLDSTRPAIELTGSHGPLFRIGCLCGRDQ